MTGTIFAHFTDQVTVENFRADYGVTNDDNLSEHCVALNVFVNRAEAVVVRNRTTGWRRGAAFDVFENKTLDQVSITSFPETFNLLLMPQIACVTVESNRATSAFVVKHVHEVVDGATPAGGQQ